MEPNLSIKYVERNSQTLKGFDLGLLGESFVGFNEVIKEIFEISEIEGDLQIKTLKVTEGSIILQNLLHVNFADIPFHDVRSFLDFLQVSDPELFSKASSFFTEFGNAHKSVNDYFRVNQFDSTVFAALFGVFVTKMLTAAPKQKESVTTDIGDFKISEKFARRIRQTVMSGKYKKALKPLIENNLSMIKVTSDHLSPYEVTIDGENFENYLPVDEKILPDFENGQVKELFGMIVTLQSMRGEKVGFKAYEIDPQHQVLIAHPDEGKQTEDYKDFYKKQVNIKAEVYRNSMYKKPEIIIREIELLQQELFEEEIA